jgi:hypothetical protein
MLSQRIVQAPSNDALPLEMEESAARVRRQPTAAMRESESQMERSGFADWYAGLSRGAKLRFGLLILLILFLLGVVVPMTLWTLIYGVPPAARSFSQALAAVYSMGSYELAAADRERAQAIALVDSHAPQTPTYTPPPTNTPFSTPTFIPTAAQAQGPTSEPVFIPASAAQQQSAVQDAPSPTPGPAVEAAVAVRAWDRRLEQLGVTIEDAQVSPGQQYWRLIEGRWADEAESAGKHHIYVEVLDENGNRVVGQPVTVWWGDGFNSGPIEDKTPPDFGYNFQMYAAGFAYNTKVEGMPSDVVKGAGMGSIDQRFYGIHTSFYFVFQRATK